ncbi:ABC transporter ATP-binding protein/permease [Eubacterium sp. MSJ-13]|uniref:ABC transporter ATP-binding protein n=1 Tax=Eubacterium sp. MSJ-13 TaxID=2841513 RepID=UPI001C115196|nr:ABC transporter ATP-binding protein [Eubacterium sp. MSJ-13]MBU5478965.1 ABC transporter ATP-binding protein/permease [Eubacterium sp. MSJ-13]
MSKKEMIKTNLRGLKLVYSSLSIPKIFVILFVVFDVMYNYWGLFFASRLIDDLVLRVERERILGDFLGLTVGNGILYFAMCVVVKFYFYGGSMIWEDANHELNKKLMSMDYEYMESETIQNKRRDIDNMAREHGSGLNMLFWTATPFVERLLQLIVAGIITVQLFVKCLTAYKTQEWKGILIVLSFVAFLIIFLYVNQRMTQKIQAKINKSVEERLPYTRKYDFYVDEYIGREECGKTVRLFNQQSLLSETLNEIFEKVSKLLSRQTILEARMNQWAEGINVLISGMIYLLLGIMALKRVISVGSICLYAGCITNFLWHFQRWNQQVSVLKMNTKYVKQYLDFLDIKNKKYEGTLPVEKRDDDKFMIEFENVSFHYPGSEKNILENFSIRFNIGERLAVVGRNGSGKTTFIKLLCRLYDPTEGRILLNGIDIKKYDYKEYLSLFSVVFQDFQIPAFTLGQAVAASQEYDEEQVNDAVKKAGLSSLAARMPYGNETYLTKEFDKTGVDISGGEAQKLAIARALYHDTPFVILDEPTAALDPIAEYEVYAKFDELIGTKTAVYISHRLSSCQFCNDILVIDDGKAVQRGSHEKLIGEEGLYAKLWKTQAKYYQKTQ